MGDMIEATSDDLWATFVASEFTLVFLDADILARPVTRTPLMVGGDEAGITVTWSDSAETDHLPGCGAGRLTLGLTT